MDFKNKKRVIIIITTTFNIIKMNNQSLINMCDEFNTNYPMVVQHIQTETTFENFSLEVMTHFVLTLSIIMNNLKTNKYSQYRKTTGDISNECLDAFACCFVRNFIKDYKQLTFLGFESKIIELNRYKPDNFVRLLLTQL